MSSTVNVDMALISTSNIIPKDQLRRVFEECVKELGGYIKDGSLYLDNVKLGKLTINDRIVLSFDSDYENFKRRKIRTLLRDTFTRRVTVAHDNYLSELKKEKERLNEQSRIEKELLDSLKEIEKKIEKSEIGFERQTLSECEALKGEIVDAALAKGYEVVEEQTSEGIQLQFVRRDY